MLYLFRLILGNCLVAGLALSGPLGAQAPPSAAGGSGAIRGKVLAENGRGVPQAAVYLRRAGDAPDAMRWTNSDTEGNFHFDSLAFSQQGTPPAGTASISGHVTIGKDPAVGVLVAAQRELQHGEPIVLETVAAQAYTDSEGSYLLSGLKAGSYNVRPFAAGFVNAENVPVYHMTKTRSERTIHLEEGDRVAAIDFALSPGGVIFGRIVDTDGWPVAAKQVHLTMDVEKRQVEVFLSSFSRTDDRGMYRLFGVPPGHYYLSVGEISSDAGGGHISPMDPPMPVTYYPGVAATAQATMVEVAESRETSGIDFKAARILQGYRVSGFMREAESEQPVPNQRFLISPVDERGRTPGPSAYGMAGGNGEFEQGGLSPGKYILALSSSEDAIYSADPVPFEIQDQDIKDLILRLRRGDGEISGQVVLEELTPAEAAAQLRTLELRAEIRQERTEMWRVTVLAADGSFSMLGLPPGKILFSLNSNDFSLTRYEFNGPPGNYLLAGFPLEPGGRIGDLKLYFVAGKGTLTGIVRTKTGPLPVGVKCELMPIYENSLNYIFPTETDDRGMFRFEGLPPGEVILHIYPSYATTSTAPSKEPGFREIQQRITIHPRQETRLEAVIELVPEKREEPSDVDNP